MFLQPNVCSFSAQALQASDLLGPGWQQQAMDQAGDLETFEELVTELGGFGKYQKRLLCLLAAFLFTTIPILQCHQVAKRLSRKIKTNRNLLPQVFVLHSPNHKCLPGNQLPTHHEMNLSKDEWNEISVKTSCMFKGFTKEQLRKIKTIVRQNPSSDRLQGVYDIQVV